MNSWFQPGRAFHLSFSTWSLVTRRRWRFLLGVLTALLVIGLLQLGVLQPLEDLAYTSLFHLRGSIPWSDRVAVIEIDESSLGQLGRFPWSRQHYTELLKVLTPAEPTAVVLDILFSEASPDDLDLAAAITRQGRVVLAQSWNDLKQPLLPTPVLRSAALATGHVYTVEDADGLVRSIELHKQGIPALGVAAVQIHSLVYEPVPLPEPDHPLWINWFGLTRQVDRYSFSDVIQKKVPASNFHNKLVLVGVTAAALDPLQTPYERNPPTSGVYLHAAVIGNLIEHNALRRPGLGWLPLALIFIGPSLSLVLSSWQLNRQLVCWASLCLGWSAVSLLLFYWNYWIPVVGPMVLFTLTTAAIILADQYRITQLLQQSEERYALAVQGSNGGLWDWNLETDTIYVSPRWKSMLGYGDAEIDTWDGRSLLKQLRQRHIADLPKEQSSEAWFSRVHPTDIHALRDAIAAHLQGTTAYLEHEYRMRHQDGDYRWMLSRGLAVRDKTGKAYRMAGSQTDITARKEAEDKLRQNAFYDELTGLPNRALFLERLKDALALTHQFSSIAFAVLWLDLDHFKVVNNSLGSDIGDRLLVATAQRLRSFLPAEDVVARSGGDEFTILLNQIRDVHDAVHTADRIQQLLALPFNLDNNEVYTSASIGIALSSLLYKQPENLLRDADTAMHRAKVLGRARCQVFDTAMRTRLVERLQLQNDLRRAISAASNIENDRQALQLYYQPIVQLTTGQITGFEALVRWLHPEQGMVSPGRFISVAEETGLIIQLGWWVLREACRQMRQWRICFPSATPLTMSVNLSSKQFSMSGLTEQIRQILQETQLDASYLKLEITESTVMENASSVTGVLRQIRSLGIQLAIDDFGTGYSSLSYLPRFPINTLKIDRSFIKKMGASNDGVEIVRTILALAHNLGMDVTAEGVETAEQAAQLLEMQCEYGQGYFFSKPMNGDSATRLLEQQLYPKLNLDQ